MPKLNEKQLLGVTIGIFVLLAGGVAFADWWLWEKDYKVKIEQQKTLEGEIMQLEKKKQELDQYRKELEDLKKQEADIQVLLPTAAQVTRGQFISMLRSFENEASVQVTDLTEVPSAPVPGAGGPGAAAAKPPFDTIDFKITVKGGFFEVVHFMHMIENHTRLMKVVEGGISPDSAARAAADATDDKKTPVTLDFKVSTYLYSEPPKAKAPAGPAGPGGPAGS